MREERLDEGGALKMREELLDEGGASIQSYMETTA